MVVPAIETLTAFALAATLLALAPGPDNLFVLTQAALYGPRAGLLVTLGLCSGLIVHTLAVAAGVAVIFSRSPLAFAALKVAGSCYLLYLAVSAWRAGAVSMSGAGARAFAPLALYRRGVVMNVTNPKVSLFFLAFLPQFTDSRLGSVPLQVATLGGVFALVTIGVFAAVAVAAGRLGAWLQRTPRWQQALNRLAAVLFVLLAGSLLLTAR